MSQKPMIKIDGVQIKFALTDEDWAQIWAEFEDTDVESAFQDYMVETYGPGYYVDADDRYWIFQQQVIRHIVDSKLAGGGT